LELSTTLLSLVQQKIQQFDLPDEFMHSVEHYFLPLSSHIAQQQQALGRCMLVSINGSQGSGKTTMTAFLQLILHHQFDINCAVVSIDDFYHTHAQRQMLARQVHPLLQTRGVPGTHDLALATQTLQGLRDCSEQSPCAIPVFDKSRDDRAAREDWKILREPVQVILFEGWCNNAPPQSEAALAQPINELEANEDRDAVWRRYVNAQLIEYHQQLFDQTDCLVFMKIPDFEMVYEWRGLQEHKLKKSTGDSAQAVMDEQQLVRFIQHYERITRACLQGLPELADIVLLLGEDHAIYSMQITGHPSDG
jgi:D-glycerate 3-kinase